MKVLSAYEQRIEDALVAEDKRLKEEEELKKSEEEMKKGGGKKKRLLKGEEEKKGVRSEQPLEDETNQLYMHEDPEEDGVLRPYLAWRYAIKQTNNEGKVRYLPAPDNERAYPLLNCELHGRNIWLHQAQGHVKPQASTTVTQAFGNFMYSKMVNFFLFSSASLALRPAPGGLFSVCDSLNSTLPNSNPKTQQVQQKKMRVSPLHSSPFFLPKTST